MIVLRYCDLLISKNRKKNFGTLDYFKCGSNRASYYNKNARMIFDNLQAAVIQPVWLAMLVEHNQWRENW